MCRSVVRARTERAWENELHLLVWNEGADRQVETAIPRLFARGSCTRPQRFFQRRVFILQQGRLRRDKVVRRDATNEVMIRDTVFRWLVLGLGGSLKRPARMGTVRDT